MSQKGKDIFEVNSDDEAKKLFNEKIEDKNHLDSESREKLLKAMGNITKLRSSISTLEIDQKSKGDLKNANEKASKRIIGAYRAVKSLHKLEKRLRDKMWPNPVDAPEELRTTYMAIKALNSYYIDEVFVNDMMELHKVDQYEKELGIQTPTLLARNELEKDNNQELEQEVANCIKPRLDLETYKRLVFVEMKE